ncbi:MAG: M28 family peptidase [Planctomycetes bacterium]|nr:M28 family peptidase [Planctomycetota bacterium]
MTRNGLRGRTVTARAILVASCALFVTTSTAFAGGTLDVCQQINVASYQHYLEDLLYTHAGDNRGYGPEHDLARANIVSTFESFGFDVTLEPFDYSGTEYYNVVAVKQGSFLPNSRYIIGAHFDSANNPGADDNGSGTAGVMEIARVLAPLDFAYTIVFIAFDREEQGLHGSDAYATAHAGDDIRGMVSLDMIAYNSGAESVDLYGRAASNSVKDALADAVADYSGGLDLSIQGSMDASDHAPFEWQGFPACLIIEDWGNPYYHTQSDNVDMPGYLDYDFAVKVCRSVTGWLADAAVRLVPACTADLDASGDVGFGDILTIIGAWGACSEACPEDLDASGDVGFGDVLAVIGAWGPCPL